MKVILIILIRKGIKTHKEKTQAQRKDHVRTQQGSGHLQLKREVSGKPESANTLTFDF